jgi:hypothetical protein
VAPETAERRAPGLAHIAYTRVRETGKPGYHLGNIHSRLGLIATVFRKAVPDPVKHSGSTRPIGPEAQFPSE